MISVDIVLPYYNGSRFIKEQIESIFQNNIEGIDLKLIIVNDASRPDETKYLKKILTFNHIYIENEVNLGVIKSVEKGLFTSTAPYVMLCDQDDVWLEKKIATSVSKIKDFDEATLIYTDLKIVDTNLITLHHSMANFYKYEDDNIKPAILFQNIVTGCTIIMNRQLLNFALPFPDKIPMHDHWLAACATFYGQIEFMPVSTILYRQHGSNQIGAPKRFNKSFKKFQKQIDLKINLISELSTRTEKAGKINEAEFLSLVAKRLKRRSIIDIYRLCKTQVIAGSILKKLIKGVLLFLSDLKFQ